MAAQPKALPAETQNYLAGRRPDRMADDRRSQARRGDVRGQRLDLHGDRRDRGDADPGPAWSPNNHFISASVYNEIFTMHGTTMIFLVLMPLEVGFLANFVMPLQIGARDVAFPRLNALSFWIFLCGAIFLHLGWLWGGLPDAGWFGYANLTERYFSPGLNLDFWVVGLLTLGRLDAGQRTQLFRDDRRDARQRHVVHAHADVRVVDLGHLDSDPDCVSAADGGTGIPAARSLFRHALLRRDVRRHADSVAASVLAIRAS